MPNHDFAGGDADVQSGSPDSRVLYVDRDREGAVTLVSALEERVDETTIEFATTAASCLSRLEEHPIDCIVSEYDLADGDGIQLLETIRDRSPELPFVLYTADGDEHLASDAVSAGVTEYVVNDGPESITRVTDTVNAILEQRHAEGRLTGAKTDEFRTLVDDIDDHAIFLLDTEGYIASWNSGAEQIKGYQREEILGEHFSAFYPEEAVADGKPGRMLARARTQGRVEDEGWRVRKDGTRFWAYVVVTVLRDDEGAVRGYAKFTRDLTEQREREHRIRRQHDLTERILDTVPVGVAVHSPEDDLVRANARAKEILDVIDEQPRQDGIRIYDADGTPLGVDELPSRQVFRTGEAVSDTELAFERPDGSLQWMSVNSVPMYDPDGEEIERVITTGQDITRIKRREQQLREARGELERAVEELEASNRQLEMTENRFEALTKNSSFGVVSIDSTSTVRFANDTIEDIFGYEPEEVVGSSLTRLMPERLRPEHTAAIDRYLETGERQLDWEWVELPGQHKDGHEIDLGLSFGEVRVDGELLFTGVIRDISEQKERQRELEQRRRELDELVTELERSNEELQQFAYVVSHDLKEPLRMVSSYLQLLERRYRDELDEDASEFIDAAVDGASRMQRMIEDLLEYSRVGQGEQTREPVDCGEVLEEVRAVLAETERVDIDAGDLPTVSGTRSQLAKVFQNLLSNAINHSDEGEVEVRVSAERVDGMWRFAVADNGPGFPPEQTEDVFGLFYSASETGDTGVGLAICKKVVEHHGGHIWVDTEPGEGTTFYFTLPAAGTDDDRR